MYWPINYAGRKTSCVRTLLLGLEVQIHDHFSSIFLIDSLHEHEFHSLYNETHWFEWSAFVVSGTDIPNADHEVHIQHVVEKFDRKCNCFKHIPCDGNDYHRAPEEKYSSKCQEKSWVCKILKLLAEWMSNTETECTWSYILGIRNGILSEYRAWFHRNTSQHLVTSKKTSPILSQNDKKQTKTYTRMMIQACHRPSPNCHWLRPRKSWLETLIHMQSCGKVWGCTNGSIWSATVVESLYHYAQWAAEQ